MMASLPFLVLSFACNAFSSLAAHLGQAQSSLYSPFLAWGEGRRVAVLASLEKKRQRKRRREWFVGRK